MRSQKNLPQYPIAEVFLSLLSDGTWRDKSELFTEWRMSVPTVFFARRLPFAKAWKVKTVDSLSRAEFARMVADLVRKGRIEREPLNRKINPVHYNWRCRIVPKLSPCHAQEKKAN